ncbi:MAG: hypothetical protein PHV73_03780 [Eubacteriales bacterium]|nr:hypothetical protein [Eubacteriales bacterium]
MRWLTRHLPERFHKRTLVVSIIVILVVAMLVGLVLWSARAYVAPENTTTFLMPQKQDGQVITGLGVNLQNLPSANLIRNGAFDQPLVQTQYLVNGGSEDKFSVTASESIGNLPLADDFFRGADINIYRSDQDGLQKLHSATITDYEIGRLLNQISLELPTSLNDVHWYDFAESDSITERVVAVGSDGTLLSIGRSGETKVIRSGHEDNITSIVYGSDGFLAVDLGGRFYVSDDGLDFNELDLQGNGPLLDVAYRADAGGASGFYLVAGQSGQLYLGRNREFELLELEFEESLNALVVPEEGIMYALGDKGTALYSHNGIDWLQDETLASGKNWLCGDATEDVMFFAGTEGLMAIKHGDSDFEVLDPELLTPVLGIGHDFELTPDSRLEILWPTLQEVSLFTSEHIIMISESGNAFQSLNQADDWERVSTDDNSAAAMTNMDRLPSGRVFIAKQDGSIDWATFSSVFTFAPTLPSGILSGDYVTVDLETPIAINTAQLPELYPETDVQPGEWLVSGRAAASAVALSDTGYVESSEMFSGGRPRDSVLRLNTAANEVDTAYSSDDARLDQQKLFSLRRKALISDQFLNPMRPHLDLRLVQKIDTTKLIRSVEPSVYPLELDVYLEGEILGPLEIWMSGSDFEVSEEIYLRQGWQHINVLLLLPRPIETQDEVFFNIGFAGKGTICLDNIFLGRTDESPNDMSALARNIAENAPEFPVLRLDCVPIGKPGYKAVSWVLPEGETSFQSPQSNGYERHNLGAVLKLSEAVSASPWLVLDTRAGEEEIHNLLDYLAGSALSGYGKIRANDGMLGRWTDVFDLVYIEVVDTADTLPSDRLKAQRVDWVVDQCQRSPVYEEITNKLVFIDGMEYEEGGLRTNVDFHASTLQADQRLSGSAELENFLTDWKQSLPRRAIVGSAFRPELISSLAYESTATNSVRLADLAALSLSGLGNETELLLLDVNMLDQTYYEGDNIQTAVLELADSLSGSNAFERAGRELTHDSSRETETLPESGPDIGSPKESENYSLMLFSFKTEEGYLLVAVNLGENAEQFVLRGLPESELITQRRYDSSGRLIGEDQQTHGRSYFSVMPGAFVVLRVELAD